MAGSSVFKEGATTKTKKNKKPSQIIPATMCIHRNAICSMLEGLAAKDTSSLQKTNEKDRTSHAIGKSIMSPLSLEMIGPGIVCQMEE